MSSHHGSKKNFDKKKIGEPKIASAALEGLESRVLLSASQIALPSIFASPDAAASSIAGYSPAQIRTAYGFNSVTLGDDLAGTGAGQTIAIIDAYGDPDISGDLATFDSQFDLSAASLKVVSETGSSTALPAANSGWDLETSLDVEWAHAIAPSASLLLVEANSASLGDLLDAVNYARGVAGVSVISMSWGSSEFAGETSYDSYFTTPSGHQGITFIAASGDEGSDFGPEWPASSPNVLSVGGTTLDLANSSGTYGSETGWSGSTGGVSRFEREPNYQSDVQDTGAETSPDVAYDANPYTGFAVYDSIAYDGDKGWWEVGGTSAGTPQWSALVAIADQGRAIGGLGTLNGTTQTLPLLFSLYNDTQYSQAFHDETIGSSGIYAAGPGYDLVTGLGSPKANYIIQELVADTAASAAGSAATSKSVSISERTAFRRIDLINNPPPLAAVAPVPVTLSPTTIAVGSPHLASVLSIAAPVASAGAVQAGNSIVASPMASSAAITAAPSHSSGASAMTEGFSVAPSDFAIDQQIIAGGVFSATRTAYSITQAASANLLDNLLISNASAIANVANTVAVRLFDEEAMLWEEAAAVIGAGVLIGTHFMRRPGDPADRARRIHPRFLCVGERFNDATAPIAAGRIRRG